jgi:hypothetical protein
MPSKGNKASELDPRDDKIRNNPRVDKSGNPREPARELSWSKLDKSGAQPKNANK